MDHGYPPAARQTLPANCRWFITIPISTASRARVRLCNAEFAGTNQTAYDESGSPNAVEQEEVSSMATTVPEPPKIEPLRSPSLSSGRAAAESDSCRTGTLPAGQRPLPGAASTGHLGVLAAIKHELCAIPVLLTCASGIGARWRHFSLPRCCT